MINFKTIKYSNLCSYGDVPFFIDFHAAKTSAFTGINGAGKSTILDALAFALYGKPWRKIAKAKLVNNKNKRATLVHVEFATDRNEYSVTRGIKPDIFEIRRDGVLINQDAKSADYQKMLEDDILGLSWQAFNQVVVIGKATYVPFMQLDTPQRRLFVESVLGLQIFTSMKEALRAEVSRVTCELGSAQTGLTFARPQVGTAQQNIDTYNAMKADPSALSVAQADELIEAIDAALLAAASAAKALDAEYAALLDSEKTRIQAIIDAAQAAAEGYDEVVSTLNAEYAAATEAVKAINEFVTAEQRDHDRLLRQANGLDTRTNCPTCGGPIDTTSIFAHQDELKKQAALHLAAIASTASDLKEATAAVAAAQAEKVKADAAMTELTTAVIVAKQLRPGDAPEVVAKRQEYQDAASGKMSVETDLRHANEKRVEALRRETELDGLIAQAEQAKLTAIELEKQFQDRVSAAVAEERINIALTAMLKDTGAKATIIRKYLPVLNKIVNEMLSDMGFFARFQLDEEFNDSILARGFEEMTYNGFSEGEKLRIDMAVLLAWRELCIMSGSSSTNLIIFDEILDASFDAQGLNAFMESLRSKDDLNMICITHHPERFDEHIDRHLKFSKVDGYSRVEESTE